MMHKVHLCRGGKWQYIFLKDEVFNSLVQANIVRYVNTVYAIRPYITKNNETRPLFLPIHPQELHDFQIRDNQGNLKPAIE